MALATRCPHCQTTFRVAHDQLKLRAGIVRCGACKQIFNGIEHLLPPEEVASSLAPAARVSGPVASLEAKPVAPSAPDFSESHSENQADLSSIKFTINSLDFDVPIEPPPAHQETITPESPPELNADYAAAAPAAFTKADYYVDQSPESIARSDTAASSVFPMDLENAHFSDAAEQTNQFVPTLQPKAEQADEAEDAGLIPADEPGFIKKWHQQQRTGTVRRVLMSVSAVILFIGLLAQSVYIFHKPIAAWVPSMEPVLAHLCGKMGCQVNLPTQITAVSIESSELQTLVAGKNTFALTLLLGNHSQVMQAWPNIELTLNDGNEQPVGRRIFMPNEYLATSLGAGIPANTEQAVKIFFELTQLKASGYRVYLFYS